MNLKKNKQQSKDIICTNCSTLIKTNNPKRTFEGFFKYLCPICNKTVLYPLSFVYRMFYMIFFAIFLWSMIFPILAGVGPKLPNYLFLALFLFVFIFLIKDHLIRRKVKKAEKK